MKGRQRIAALLALSIFASSLATYGYAFLSHPVNVTHVQGLSGGFVDDSGVWSIQGTFPAVFVSSFSAPASGTSIASAKVLANGVGIVSEGVTPGDWALELLVKNSSDLPASTTWSVLVTINGDGGISSPFITLYFATPATLTSTSTVDVLVDLSSSLVTPLSYTVFVQTV